MANYDRTINGKSYIEYQFWLVFANDGAAPKVYSKEPNLARHQRSMFMHITLPTSLWETPSLRGTVMVEDPGLNPVTIDREALASAVRQAIGMDVSIVVVPPLTGAESEETRL